MRYNKKNHPIDDFRKNSDIMELEMKIKNAKLLTVKSCGLFAPVTAIYIAKKKLKLRKLREENYSPILKK
jgi:hypothetical protein